MTLTDTYDKLAGKVEAQLVAAYESWQDGLITEAEFYAVATAYLGAGVNRAGRCGAGGHPDRADGPAGAHRRAAAGGG